MESASQQRFLFESLLSLCNKIFDRHEERTCTKHGLAKHLNKFERKFARIVDTAPFTASVRKFSMRNRANATLSDNEWLDSNVSFVHDDLTIPISAAYTTAVTIKSEVEEEIKNIPASLRTPTEDLLFVDSLHLAVVAVVYNGVPTTDETKPRIESTIRSLTAKLPTPVSTAILGADFALPVVAATSQTTASSSAPSATPAAASAASAANPLSSILSSLMGTVASAVGSASASSDGAAGDSSSSGAEPSQGPAAAMPDASQMSTMLSSIFNSPATQNIIGSLLQEVKTCRRPEEVVQKGFQLFSDPKIIDSISKIKLDLPNQAAQAAPAAATPAPAAAPSSAPVADSSAAASSSS